MATPAAPRIAALLALVARHRAPLAALFCGVVFFLGTADRLFAIRAEGVNVRFANLMLAVGLLAWTVVRRMQVLRDVAPLAIAWLPFALLYAAAALRSPEPVASLVKLAWFGFGFVGAFVWCRLFDVRDVVAGLFGAFAVVATIICIDFATGFMHGERYMIGYGQPNDLAGGEILWRPHAFYYEPSYAASGIALAWALAMTPIGRVAPWIATTLVIAGTMALTVVMSRTGWLYALIVLLVLAFQRVRAETAAKRIRWPAVLLASIGGAIVVTAVAVSDHTAPRFGRLVEELGVERTFERICPLLRSGVRWLDLRCRDSEEALRSAGFASAADSGEGQRIVDAKRAIDRIGERPWLGYGVERGDGRLLEPTASNVWLEIAVEGGLLSAVAFAWGLGFTLVRFDVLRSDNRLIALVLILYFAVAWQFLQTFPRLDQWLVFWVALTYTSRSPAGAPAR